MPRGDAAQAVASNVRRLRHERHWSLESLSKEMSRVGRPMIATALSKIEQADRRVDVDDLVALATAFRVELHELLGPRAWPVVTW